MNNLHQSILKVASMEKQAFNPNGAAGGKAAGPGRVSNSIIKLNMERAKLRQERRRNIIISALMGGILGATGGGLAGITYNNKGTPLGRSVLAGVGLGGIGGALLGGLGANASDKILSNEYESDLKEIAETTKLE